MLYLILLIPLLATGGALIWWSKRKIYRYQRPLLTVLIVVCVISLASNIYYWRDIKCYFQGGKVIETTEAVVKERHFRKRRDQLYVELDDEKLWGHGMPEVFGGAYSVSYDSVILQKGQQTRITYLPNSKLLLKVEAKYDRYPGMFLDMPYLIGRSVDDAGYVTVYEAGIDAGTLFISVFILLVAGCLIIPALIWFGQGK